MLLRSAVATGAVGECCRRVLSAWCCAGCFWWWLRVAGAVAGAVLEYALCCAKFLAIRVYAGIVSCVLGG